MMQLFSNWWSDAMPSQLSKSLGNQRKDWIILALAYFSAHSALASWSLIAILWFSKVASCLNCLSIWIYKYLWSSLLLWSDSDGADVETVGRSLSKWYWAWSPHPLPFSEAPFLCVASFFEIWLCHQGFKSTQHPDTLMIGALPKLLAHLSEDGIDFCSIFWNPNFEFHYFDSTALFLPLYVNKCTNKKPPPHEQHCKPNSFLFCLWPLSLAQQA